MDWTPENVGTLSRLVDGGLSANEIAVAMETTRNTIIARIHRTGLKLKTPPTPAWDEESATALRLAIQEGLGIAAAARRLVRSTNSVRAKAERMGLHFGHAAGVPIPRAPSPEKVVIPMPVPAPQEPAGRPLGYSLVELPAKGCKFPLDLASADVMMCGEPRGLDDPAYCPKCRARASYPITKTSNQQMRSLRRYTQ